MATVTINGETYETYADVATADTYLNADLALSAGWSALSTDDKGRALVGATRVFDTLDWKGKKTSDSQPIEWPRTGIDGVDPNVIPDDIIAGNVTYAAQIGADPTIVNNQNSGNNQKRAKAGSAEIEYFSPSDKNSPKLPVRVNDLVAKYFGSSGSMSLYTGGNCDQYFGTSNSKYDRSWPWG